MHGQFSVLLHGQSIDVKFDFARQECELMITNDKSHLFEHGQDWILLEVTYERAAHIKEMIILVEGMQSPTDSWRCFQYLDIEAEEFQLSSYNNARDACTDHDGSLLQFGRRFDDFEQAKVYMSRAVIWGSLSLSLAKTFERCLAYRSNAVKILTTMR